MTAPSRHGGSALSCCFLPSMLTSAATAEVKTVLQENWGQVASAVLWAAVEWEASPHPKTPCST